MLDKYFTTTRPDMQRFVPATMGNVLEVGCSAGGFSGAFMSRSNEIWGIEPNPEAAATAKTRLTHVLNGLYDDQAPQLPDHHYDVVICNDVIEHMPDHDRFLEDIKIKLKPGAILIGSLPNMRFITAMVKLMILKDWQYRESGILDRTHLRFFTRKSILRSLDDHGYEVEAIHGGSSVFKDGFCEMKGWRGFAGQVFTAAMIAVTFGYYYDIQYPQYGFRARLRT